MTHNRCFLWYGKNDFFLLLLVPLSAADKYCDALKSSAQNRTRRKPPDDQLEHYIIWYSFRPTCISILLFIRFSRAYILAYVWDLQPNLTGATHSTASTLSPGRHFLTPPDHKTIKERQQQIITQRGQTRAWYNCVYAYIRRRFIPLARTTS